MSPELKLINDCLSLAIADPVKVINAQRKLGIPTTVAKTPHTLITIQYSEKYINDREKQINMISSLLNYKWFKNSIYHYTFEYFSKHTENNLNGHIHLLLHSHTLCKTKILRDIHRKIPDAKTINYQASSSFEHYSNRLRYITAKPESEFTKLDNLKRMELNISPYYTNGLSQEESISNPIQTDSRSTPSPS